MTPVTISYPVFVLLLATVCVLSFCVSWCVVRARWFRRENLSLSNAYAELTIGAQKREAALLAEKQTASRRMRMAEEDADRLAPTVAEYVRIVDETAALLKDDNAPQLLAERDALRLHADALKFRTNEITRPEIRPDEKANAPSGVHADAATGR